MPDELLAGQDTPAQPSEVQQPQSVAANTESAESSTQGDEGGKDTAVAPKTYSEEEVQERIERATAKAAAKAERKALREAREILMRAQPQAQPQPQQVDERPQRLNGESDEDYLDRLTDWKLDRREKQSRSQTEQVKQQSLIEKTEKLYAEAEKLPGFDRDDFESLPLTPAIASAITDSDVAAKLMAYFVGNPAEVDRLRALPAARQAAEIGKLETKLSKPVEKPKAPDPINPIGGNGAPVKNLTNSSMDDFIAMRRKQGSRWI